MEQWLELTLQGRKITTPDIELVRNLIASNPSWNRTRLSKELCLLWDWRRTTGELKDMACRSLLRKLEQLGYIQLPKAFQKNDSPARRNNVQAVLHCKSPIQDSLKNLYPIDIQLVEKGYGLKLFKYFISAYHYLGWSGTVGENLKYMFFDVHERPLGCLMFGAAAWKVKPRDNYIGWTPEERVRNLSYVVNNNRFLVLPWVSYLAKSVAVSVAIGKRNIIIPSTLPKPLYKRTVSRGPAINQPIGFMWELPRDVVNWIKINSTFYP
jgi:hypothetical protein